MIYKLKPPRSRPLPLNRLKPMDVEGKTPTNKRIQGIEADSWEEVWWSEALDQLTTELVIDGYMYQFQFIEALGVPGEARVDFLVFSRPKSTPTEIDGHFHITEEDLMRDTRLNDIALKEGMNEVVHVQADQIIDKASALVLAREIYF